MAVQPGTWTTDSSGQQWIYSSSGWGKASGVSGDGFVEFSSIDENDRPGSSSKTSTVKGKVEKSETTLPTIKAGPVGEATGASANTLRWPEDIKYDKSDYVLFQFGKYKPPFSNDVKLSKINGQNLKKNKDVAKANKEFLEKAKKENLYGYDSYNAENIDVDNNGGLSAVVLPIPQDLSNEIQQVWQGKQFTAGGRAAIAGLAGGQFHYAGEMAKNITGHLKAAQTAITTAALNAIPGVGGNIEFNDVSGSTRGIVINPNAELLYDSPEMREIGMVFKMVPRNEVESSTIRKIYQTFRMASLPSFGGDGQQEGMFSRNDDSDSGVAGTKEQQEFSSSENNWIRVPNLCKFTFMQGSDTHPHLIQFKPCAISKVEVNYTADGTYATYSDGAPLSVELTLNFMETKVIFRKDVKAGF